MNLPTTFNSNQLPAHLQKRVDKGLTDELGGGVTSGFPVISYRGKVWRIQKGGQEVNYVDANEDPIPSIEVVLLKAKPRPSKIFYAQQYEEGSNAAPTCWSADGIKPDAGVTNPVNHDCASCPNNVWGSRITEAGKKSRKCTDTRRMAVVFAHELATKGEHAHVFLMRVPPASLNPLKDYGEKILGPKGIPYYGVVTRIGFDPQAAHPKLTFRATGFLPEDQFSTVERLRSGPDVAHILAESVEFDGDAGTTGLGQAANDAGGASASSAPQKPRPAPAAPRVQPVEQEDVPVAVMAEDEQDQGSAPVAEPVPEVSSFPPAQAPRQRKRKAAQPETVSTQVPKEEVGAVGANDFDAMLKSILG